MSPIKLSVEEYDAFTPRNLFLEGFFWKKGLPLGRVGIKYKNFINIDVPMENRKLNCTKLLCLLCYQVCTVGNYLKDTNLIIIFSIELGDHRFSVHREGSIRFLCFWIWVRQVGLNYAETFASFCNDICSSIEGLQRITSTNDRLAFLWENLRAHYAPIFSQTVEGHNVPKRFSILPIPSYQPKQVS